MRQRATRSLTALAVLCLLAATAGAQDPNTVRVSGFGGWAYTRTDENVYLGGSPKGDYDRVELGLNVSATPTERLTIVSQVLWDQTDEGTRAEVDYAFAEWRFSDALRLRAGLAKHPVGNYSEIYNVGTLRPFFDLPQATYAAGGFVTKSYKGLGLTGLLGRDDGGGFGLTYDVYGGELNILDRSPLLSGDSPVFALVDVPREENVADLIGARLTLSTPVAGLKLGASAYTGTAERLEGARHSVYGGHAQFVDADWTLRSEFLHVEHPAGLDGNGFYLEAARSFGPHWQLAGQFGRLRTAKPRLPEFIQLPFGTFPVPPLPERFVEHDEWALGLNYWFTSGFVLKASYHHVSGNRLTTPEEIPNDPLSLIQELLYGMQAKTSLFQFGAQFSF